MNKSVLIAIQPYYVFLIIARLMGWDIPQEKTIEVRKNYPRDATWNKRVHIYCSRNRRSFNRIPKQYQPLVEKFLGRVIGEFVCDRIYTRPANTIYLSNAQKDYLELLKMACLTEKEVLKYMGGQYNKDMYFWHISDLKIYDKPKELREFKKAGFMTEEEWLYALYPNTHCHYNAWAKRFEITRPPQSWCYVEEVDL